MKTSVRIGNASGFWGDEPTALRDQLAGGPLDYVVLDYLAEVSMSILSKQQAKNTEAGFIADFIEHIILAKEVISKPVKIITNAGGSNPKACAIAVAKALKTFGVSKRIFYVEGDNLVPDLEELIFKGNDFSNLETQSPFSEVKASVVSANAYTNSEGIVKALEKGADIVICGRASDSALCIGPLKFEFGWKSDDYKLLGAAMIAGHIIECGAQACGGNFTDWHLVQGMENIGFPIIEFYPDGHFIVTKHPNTGGMVTINTVKEQLVYEIANPQQYFGPDVIADITGVTMEQVEENKVLVKGGSGFPPPKTWKVSLAFQDGYKCVGGLMISGPNILDKADRIKSTFWKKLGLSFEKSATQYVGFDSIHQSFPSPAAPNEMLLQFVAFDKDKVKLTAFSKQIAAMILVGPQGIAAAGGRPKIQDVIRYWPTLVQSKDLNINVNELDPEMENGQLIETFIPFQPSDFITLDSNITVTESNSDDSKEKMRLVKLREICLARSGDKGNTSNIGVIARSQPIYDYLSSTLTAPKVKECFKNDCFGTVTRYDLPKLLAFNFMLTQVLDGGGTYSAKNDPQGKTFAASLLENEIMVPESILKTLN